MNHYRSLLVLVVALCLFAGSLGLANAASATLQSYTMDWSVVGGGGGASLRLGSTIGQTAIGLSTGSHQLGSGFWYGITGEKLTVHLPLVLRNR